MRRLIVLFVCFLMCGMTAAFADSEYDGAAAEKAGKYREALNHYTAALKQVPDGSAKDQQLRETIVDIAARIKPRAAVPKEAERHLARAQAAVELAKTPRDFELAVGELKQALRIAPWWAEGYFNLGTVQEKAGQYGDAQRNLKLYLRTAPEVADARAVETAIAKIEFKQEHKAREDAGKQRLAGLSGVWTDGKDSTYRVAVAGNEIEITTYQTYLNGRWRPLTGQRWKGTIEGNRITGVYYRDWTTFPNGTMSNRSMTGTLSPDGRSIRLDFTEVTPEGADLPNRITTLVK